MEDMINFLHKIGELKKLKRAGWVLHRVPNPESIADHTFRTTVMALLLAKKAGLDTDKCVKMALVHDFAEALSGDITPHDNISDKEKHKKEKSAMKELLKDVDDKEIFNIWIEYEERKTPEAKFVYDLDKIEMVLQAYEYKQKHKGKDINLDEFWSYTKKRIKDKNVKRIFEILAKKKNRN